MQRDTIVYRELDSPVGGLVAGATAEGCCLLEFTDRGGIENIGTRIQKRYKLDIIGGTSPFLDQLESELDAYFRRSLTAFTVPLDLRGTPFQLSVWRQLLHIPYGETKTYGEIAESVGRPLAVRAVGRANGENYIAIVVPCHRVIQHDGKLRGYGGGLWRKRYLLDLEDFCSR
jgi:AraC family transcriptional regulator of adaptative response/methylated-DNA-[protein]-cysteine methyltransferase